MIYYTPVKSQHVGPSSKKRAKDREISGIQRSLICLIICATILILFFGLEIHHGVVNRIAKSFGYHEPVYAVVIDAGSTGSRILVFSFHRTYLGGRLILDRELSVEIKPVLSSFAKTPHKGVKLISKLLDLAKEDIPKKHWGKTPLVLKATADLRLLPPQEAAGLLDAVRDLFKESPFLIKNEAVSIMDGTDKGIFSWFTVNFLLDRLSDNPGRTVAALDLGGGSAQVTFAPIFPTIRTQPEFIHNVTVVKDVIPVYSNCYLGLGLMVARKEILSYQHEANATNLSSLCVNPIIRNKKFQYGGVDYLVSGDDRYAHVRGADDPKVKFDDCMEIITNYVYSIIIPVPELKTREMNAFSYYFDKATEIGLIDPSKGGIVTVQQFSDAAKEACETINVDQPFLCLDLTYIWVVLERGFSLSPKKKISLFKKIDDHELSWALGAAFNVLKQKK